MTGELAAAGDIATGALHGHAVAGAGGAGAGSAAPIGPVCLNCGTALTGAFCHVCGQNGHVHRTLGSIGHDLLHGVFHFEGKMWRTLPMLAFRPGELTRRYIAGERARFVSPLALFLFSVFLMFAAFGLVASSTAERGFIDGLLRADSGLAEGEAAVRSRLRRLAAERAAAAAGPARATIDRRIADQRRDLATLARLRRDADGKRGAAATGVAFIDHGIAKLRANPQLVFYKAQSSGYKYSWALILLSTPLVALLFLWRRRFGLYDHAIFVTYSITAMSLLAVVVELLMAIRAPSDLIAWLIALAPVTHMFVQLRGAYGLGWFSAAWRTLFLVTAAGITLVLFVLALVALGASG